MHCYALYDKKQIRKTRGIDFIVTNKQCYQVF